MAISETFAFLLSLPTSSSILNTDTVIAVTVFITLLCACIVIGHLLEENRWANESITALLLGLATGLVVLLITKCQSSRLLVFSEDLFFIYLLPPIIFNAGFQVKKKQFFENFSIILMFGICGTIISFCLVSVGKICNCLRLFVCVCFYLTLLSTVSSIPKLHDFFSISNIKSRRILIHIFTLDCFDALRCLRQSCLFTMPLFGNLVWG
ncbi:sodium/hydrogen exchanger 2-like [Camellia sinensis]|uniref:sodium/hydrogen exchanger 2-like n=1 Tax=Camellia sinensis TaxID=4442 RepID=UPI0010366B52|nr:sodium/hydrogen exchanger 2-like [Camellia sinensis]